MNANNSDKAEQDVISVEEMTTSDFQFAPVVRNQKAAYSEFDMNLLNEALEKLERTYTYNYGDGKLRGYQNRLGTIVSKLKALIKDNEEK